MNKRVGLFIIVALAAVALVAFYVNTRSESTEPRTYNLSEFGVALTVPSSLNDLAHSARTQLGINTVLHMMVDESCEIGVFYQIQKNAIETSRTSWTEETLEAAQGERDGQPAQVKEFTDFYLVFEPSEAPCSENERAAEEEAARRMDLWNAVVTARFMS